MSPLEAQIDRPLRLGAVVILDETLVHVCSANRADHAQPRTTEAPAPPHERGITEDVIPVQMRDRHLLEICELQTCRQHSIHYAVAGIDEH